MSFLVSNCADYVVEIPGKKEKEIKAILSCLKCFRYTYMNEFDMN